MLCPGEARDGSRSNRGFEKRIESRGSDQDRKDAPQVVIINETVAHQFFGRRDPIGERLNLGDSKKPDLWKIVGVAGDVHAFGLEEKVRGTLFRNGHSHGITDQL
ncbi:MAG: ABC transporter permease [Candidatus Acidiferrales bacterium]